MKRHERLSKLQRSIVHLAREYASKGLTLRQLAADFDLNYSSLKRALRCRRYMHPVGIALVAARIRHETQWALDEYIRLMVNEGLSRNLIARELHIDNKTLQAFADSHGIVFQHVKPAPNDFTNIILAIRRRQQSRLDLFFIAAHGENHCLAEWSRRSGIAPNTIKKRLQLGWTAEDAVSLPIKTRKRSVHSMSTPSASHPWRNGVL